MPEITISGPTNMKIHKKTGNDTFILYHPQTGADVVLYNGSKGLPWTNTPDGVVTYNSQGATSSSGGYYLLEDVLKYMAAAIDDFGGVLEFKGSKTVSGLPTDGNKKGEVYVVTDSTIYWRASSTDTWQQYPQDTLFVCTGEDNANYIADNSSGTNSKAGWVPLGGNNDIYARKTEAIGSVTQNGATITFGNVSGTRTIATVSFGSIGTVTAGTTTIATTIPTTGSNNAIPTVEAVRNYASSAGEIKVTAATNGYLTVVSGNTTGTYTVGVVSIAVSNGTSATPTLSANISGKAATAGAADTAVTANQVANPLVIKGLDSTGTLADGFSYDGSWTRGIKFLDGLVANYDGSNASEEVRVRGGNGITVSTNGIAVKSYVTHGVTVGANGVDINLGDGLEYGTNAIKAKANTAKGITVSNSGIGVQAGTGITVSTDGVGVKLGQGLTFNGSNSVAIAGAHTISAGAGITVSGGASYQGTATTTTVGLSATGIAAGVYSALSVDAYGRASAGAQSLVFAENINDPDLNSLVVGGLAFVGNEASYTDSANTTHSGTINPIG